MNPGFAIDERPLRERYPFARLLQPIGGLMERVMTLTAEPTAPDFHVAVTGLDNLTRTLPHVSSPQGADARDEPLGGAGADADPELAWLRAVVEGAERYASMVHEERDFVVATARELGGAALDLETIPRCSEREYAHPACPFHPPDPRARLRWVRGYSLTQAVERYVPAVMAFLYFKPWPEEMFWQMISTGIAAHTRLPAALVSAIGEVVERDAIALTWLARLPLPRIEVEEPVPPELRTNLRRLRRSLVRHHLFDATTDVGIPTVYAVQLLDGQPKLSQYVNCATDFSAAAACAKTMREAAPTRAVFQFPRDVPGEVEQFQSLYDGATYMGRPEQRPEFDFLLQSPSRRSLSDMRIAAPEGDAARLRFLVGRLRELHMEAVAVDLTSDELREAGLWVVRVVIPQLMPMSTIHRARFLGHPRLFAYPEKAGFGRRTEADVNPAPQPFA
jgi:ribosomal protein S12 methylthiotransferase accessory factor